MDGGTIVVRGAAGPDGSESAVPPSVSADSIDARYRWSGVNDQPSPVPSAWQYARGAPHAGRSAGVSGTDRCTSPVVSSGSSAVHEVHRETSSSAPSKYNASEVSPTAKPDRSNRFAAAPVVDASRPAICPAAGGPAAATGGGSAGGSAPPLAPWRGRASGGSEPTTGPCPATAVPPTSCAGSAPAGTAATGCTRQTDDTIAMEILPERRQNGANTNPPRFFGTTKPNVSDELETTAVNAALTRAADQPPDPVRPHRTASRTGWRYALSEPVLG